LVLYGLTPHRHTDYSERIINSTDLRQDRLICLYQYSDIENGINIYRSWSGDINDDDDLALAIACSTAVSSAIEETGVECRTK